MTKRKKHVRKTPTKKTVRKGGKKTRLRRSSTGRKGKSTKKNSRRISKPVSRSKNLKKNKRLPKQRRKSVKPTRSKRSTPTLIATKTRVLRDGKETRNYSNVLKLDLSQAKSFEHKIEAVRNWEGQSIINYYLIKQKLFPRGFMVIIRTGNSRKHMDQATKGRFDLHPDFENVRKIILEKMIDFQDNFYDVMDALDNEPTDSSWVYDPTKIIAVFVRFFYAA